MKTLKKAGSLLVATAVGLFVLQGCGGGGGGGAGDSSSPADAPNSAPLLAFVEPQLAIEGEQMTVAFSASDPNNDPLVFGLTGMPESGWHLGSNGVLTWTPSAGIGGTFSKTYSVVVSVSDGEDSTSQTFDITIYRSPDLASEDTTGTVGLTAFHQNIPAEDGDPEVFPGQANVWDLDQDFSLFDGGDRQFEGALEMKVGAADFPKDLSYSELTFYTPYATKEDGVEVVLVDSSGDSGNGFYSAWFNGTSNSSLEQTIDLAGFSAGEAIELSWVHDIDVDWETRYPTEGDNFYYRVKMRTQDGSEDILFNGREIESGTEYKDISSYAGQIVTLVIELHYASNTFQSYALIDDVSVRANATELVVNGDFESGNLQGWKTNDLQDVQNVASGVRSLEGLDVSRQFYTLPNNLWGRWVDVFTNTGSSDITTGVQYRTTLGSAGYGVVYDPTGTGQALTSWDGSLAAGQSSGTRDIGWVFGNAGDVLFTSLPSLDSGIGDPVVDVFYDLAVPAGQSVALVHFVLMNGKDTGQTATSVYADAVQIDNEIADILDMFWLDPQYRDGMTQAQIDAVINMPRP